MKTGETLGLVPGIAFSICLLSRFRKVLYACSLEHDLEMLPYGEDTEVGEKGINLSGASPPFCVAPLK